MLRAIVTATTLALLAGCSSNPACEEEVQDRLLSDCQLSLSSASGGLCRGLTGDPGDPGADTALAAHRTTACEIEDPDLDVDCLLAATCDEIMMGQCSSSSGSSSAETRACRAACSTTEQQCLQGCRAGGDFDGCLACELECVEASSSCRGDC